MQKYRVVTQNDDLALFNRLVTEMLNTGWQLAGPFTVETVRGDQGVTTVYYQPLLRVLEAPDQPE